MRNRLRLGLAALALVASAGCTLAKTENPLSPTIAGPLPGVNISAPNPIQPRDGQRVLNDSQPVILVLDNAQSNSVRPFTYLIEVATDAGFANVVFSQAGIAPDPSGRTTFRLPNPLPSGKSYWWRATAKDGANDGPPSPSANFEVIVPIIFQAPVLLAPINNVTVTGLRPTFSWNNADRTGSPVGAVVYDVEVSEDPSFAVKLGATVNEQAAGPSSGAPPEDGKASKHYFWRARARDLIVTGPWSATQSFNTPAGGAVVAGAGVVVAAGTACHVAAGGATFDRASQIVYGCGVEFPGLVAASSGIDQTEARAEELLLRTIWHLQLAGFQSARQRNPSQAISKDKLNIVIDGAWHTYDIFSLGSNGVVITGLNEISGTNPVPESGIPD